MTEARVERLCIWSVLGPVSIVWYLPRRKSKISPMKSQRFLLYLSCLILLDVSSRLMRWALKLLLLRRLSRLGLTIFCASKPIIRPCLGKSTLGLKPLGLKGLYPWRPKPKSNLDIIALRPEGYGVSRWSNYHPFIKFTILWTLLGTCCKPYSLCPCGIRLFYSS
jgi:hypothetical protein